MIKVPTDAKVVSDQRLTLIRIISQLTRKLGRLDELKNGVKRAMNDKSARFAESDLVIAELRGGGAGGAAEKRYVDQHKLHALVKRKRIKMSQFLDVICVRTSLLEKILSGDEIEKLYRPADEAEQLEALGSLYTEFKPGAEPDFNAIEDAMLDAAMGLSKKAA
jgi:hypothetical protein